MCWNDSKIFENILEAGKYWGAAFCDCSTGGVPPWRTSASKESQGRATSRELGRPVYFYLGKAQSNVVSVEYATRRMLGSFSLSH